MTKEKIAMINTKLKELMSFLDDSKTAFHAVANISKILEANHFTKLEENTVWEVKHGGSYYAVRNDSSLIAFRVPEKEFNGFQIIASHSDSPTFKVKEVPELEQSKGYTKLNVEGYGGMIQSTWLDRPLSLAGRVIVSDGQKIQTKLINIDKDLLMIPNQAIHMNRQINEGYKFNIQKDMLPLLGDAAATGAFTKIIAEAAGVEEAAIVGKDIFLYNRMQATVWGASQEYFSAPRIDNLECAFGSLKGFLQAENIKNVAVYGVFDNEEVGSTTKQGAASTFLQDVLRRIMLAIDKPNEYLNHLANSFMVSADNAHACHPNAPEKTDDTNHVFMNEGIVMKHSANQKYTTDGISRGILKTILNQAGIPTQDFVNRSDVAGGSTLGSIANTQVSINTVDIGLAQLAMHSAYETAGVKDIEYLEKGTKAFMEASIKMLKSGTYSIM